MQNLIKFKFLFVVCNLLTISLIWSQQVEVQGELKVTEMNANENGENLVIKNTDGTLGTRSVASLPPPPPPIDTTRNLASDFELAKHLCDCPNLPPAMIKKLLDSGYSVEDLAGFGIPVQDVIDAGRDGILIDNRDNQSYKTVTIGSQTWMAENLNFGTRIDRAINQTDNDNIEKYCYDDNTANCNLDGGLYQWNEVMNYVNTPGTQGICPTGWHLPTDDEYKTLEMELGMTQSEADGFGFRGTNQGSQLAGVASYWLDGNLDQNGVFGSSGFNLIPAGLRDDVNYFNMFNTGYLWTSTEHSFHTTQSWVRHAYRNNTESYRGHREETDGISVRCVKD